MKPPPELPAGALPPQTKSEQTAKSEESDKSEGSGAARPTSELLRTAINRSGELHLDRENAALLLRMIELDEKQYAAALSCIAELQALWAEVAGRSRKPN